jgi:hypothetical protein
LILILLFRFQSLKLRLIVFFTLVTDPCDTIRTKADRKFAFTGFAQRLNTGCTSLILILIEVFQSELGQCLF